jgi:hypothetical protein
MKLLLPADLYGKMPELSRPATTRPTALKLCVTDRRWAGLSSSVRDQYTTTVQTKTPQWSQDVLKRRRRKPHFMNDIR